MIQRLDEVCSHIVDCKNRTAPIDPDGEFFAVGTPAMRGNVINYEEARRISAETFKQWTERLMPEQGDILFAREAPVGPVVGVPAGGNVAAGQRTTLLRADPAKAHPVFLRQYLSAPVTQARILALAFGSTTPHLRVADIRSFPVDLPPLTEQQAIAEVLGALDNKIAANTKLAETTSTTSQALFQQLIAGSSELTTLGELVNLEYGKALPAAKRAPGRVAVYGSGGVVGTHNESFKDGPGIVVGRKGSAGMVYWSSGPFFPIDTTYYVDPKLGSETLPFCYHVLKSLRLAEMNSDSAVPGLNRSEALATKVQKVGYAAIAKFSAAAAPLFELAAEYEQENRTLATTRDALLPQLMSGKLRVKDIENTMGEMV